MLAMLVAAVMAMVGLMGAVHSSPSVIIVGGGMSGISAAKTLHDAGVKDIVILEATDRIGGRMHKVNFAGLNVEMGANWVEGVGGRSVNPIWTIANEKLHLRKFFSDYDNLTSNAYQHTGGLYKTEEAEEVLSHIETVMDSAANYSRLSALRREEDISVLTYQRLKHHVPSTPMEMAFDYYNSDYEFAEPPRVTSLQNTEPLPTFDNFGEDLYFVADPRGYESVVYHLAWQFLDTDDHGNITDQRLKLNKVVRHIHHSRSGVVVKTEDGSIYRADYVMVSVSIGVLQTKLIDFEPYLPKWKILAIYQFDMAVYTKIFVKFPYAFWPTGNGTQFFLYASEQRGYYPIWQHFEKEYPGSNVLLVTVTDDESRRIEQQPDSTTKAEIMEVVRKMFGEGVPEIEDIFVPRWWSNRFFKGSFSNWPIGVTRFEYDQIRAPVGRVYFTGEHTSEHYNGIHSAEMMIDCIKKGVCKVKIMPKGT
ncbi:Polyamine oxidase [Acorus gramineus]|uniref:Polyamine oxidase n=1 Tax=Acorus gramineus TaxID=55184 RepID=A0AAV9AYT8_ACOGR|nr:Polyamine oxidase [Acorus gramineus]